MAGKPPIMSAGDLCTPQGCLPCQCDLQCYVNLCCCFAVDEGHACVQQPAQHRAAQPKPSTQPAPRRRQRASNPSSGDGSAGNVGVTGSKPPKRARKGEGQQHVGAQEGGEQTVGAQLSAGASLALLK